jgi:hypothetical protein
MHPKLYLELGETSRQAGIRGNSKRTNFDEIVGGNPALLSALRYQSDVFGHFRVIIEPVM